jgi:putative RecB family exonuclease
MTIYSYSRLEAFKQCPRQFAYRYIEKPEIEKQPTIEAHLGTVCHLTVQQIYKDLLLSRQMTLEESLSFYNTCWEKEKPPNLRIIRDRYTEENYRNTGRRYVEEFYRKNSPFNDGHTIGIEKQLQIHLDSPTYGSGDPKTGRIHLTGFIDRLVDHGEGKYEIIDYKTNKELPGPDDLENNWQLPLYQIGLKAILPDLKEVTCTWYFLAHGKPISLKKQEENLEQLKTHIQTLVEKIDATSEFEPKITALCSWCDYESICPARKHLVAVEKLPPEQF